MYIRLSLRIAFLMPLALTACGSNSPTGQPPTEAGAGTAAAITIPTPVACTTVVKDGDCDTTLRPFVFVHGTYGSGDNFENVAALLASNGYCADHIVRVEYNSLGESPGNDCTAPNTPSGCGKIDAAVNAILAKFPQFTQVDLAGHSQGTEHCGNYIGSGGVGAHADKIAHYINFSGIPDVGSVPTLSLSSQHDLDGCPHHAYNQSASICAFAETADGGTAPTAPVTQLSGMCSVAPDAGAAGAGADDAGAAEGGASGDGGAGCTLVQYTFVNQDHFAVAASHGTFLQVYKYLTGKEPQYTEAQCGDDPVTIEGLAETFADNQPVGGKIEVRQVTTARAAGPPEQTITPDSVGHFVAQVSRNVFYEFKGYDAKGSLLGYTYFTPFKRSNRLVTFLTPASSTDGSLVGKSVAAETTDKLTRSPGSVTLYARWAGGAFRHDLGATLTVDGNQVLTSDNAPAPQPGNLLGGVVGLFFEDKNMNGKSDLGLVDSAPFIAFTDVSIDATTPSLVSLSLTPGAEDPSIMGNTAIISNWPSSQVFLGVFFQ